MRNSSPMLIVIIKRGKTKTITQCPIFGKKRIVVVINDQFTNAPNTTQIASGAGRSGAAGSNAAVDSSNTQQQQQSVGAGGKAKNSPIRGKQTQPSHKKLKRRQDEVIIVVNNQTSKLPKRGQNASSTQVAGGSGKDNASGTNSAVDSANTKQQHAVGGGTGSVALNKGLLGKQKETRSRRRRRRRR
jgi:hypothetical protein